MNPLSIVVLALKGVSEALTVASGFITNQTVLKVLEDVQGVIDTALGILTDVHAEFSQGVKEGKYKAGDPDIGGIRAKAA